MPLFVGYRFIALFKIDSKSYKEYCKVKENEIINAKQYENKSGSVNIVMGRVVCELLSTQYLGPRISVLEMDSNFAGHKTIKKGFSNHHLPYASCRFTKDNVMTFYLCLRTSMFLSFSCFT